MSKKHMELKVINVKNIWYQTKNKLLSYDETS